MSIEKEAWGTRVGLILAMAGNAVGLGNFLRFPVQAVNNGGGAFLIPYLVCFLLMGIPLLWIEWSMGRFGGRFGNHSTPFILDNMTKKSLWKYFGVFGIFTNVAVAAYYCYIESWTLSYVFHSIGQTFSGLSQTEVARFFTNYTDIAVSTSGIPYEAVLAYLVCLSLNVYILSRGLSGGVEKAAKIGMPLLILFGVFLAIRGVTLGNTGSCADCDSSLGLNFLWEPQFDSLSNPKVWLAAAGQIFFTLSVGMGTIHCYAAYVKKKDDIALNAMSAGWMNGFVEIVLGASIVIPIAVGYLGLDWVKENAGFSMAFQTMPYLFQQWGPALATVAGVMWFGLLFFAGITSSLAMGTPWMGFMRDEFQWNRQKSAWTFGALVLIMGLPTVLFYNEGVFGEYDYWAGTVSLVIFALAECILFAWIFGMDKGWTELNSGADINVPLIFKPIIKYVTPLLILFVFIASLVTPVNNDWKNAFQNGWELDASSIIGQIQNKGVVANKTYFADHFESEVNGIIGSIDQVDHKNIIRIVNADNKQIAAYRIKNKNTITVIPGDQVSTGQTIASGTFTNNIFFTDMSRLLLVGLFGFICLLVFQATIKRDKAGRKKT
jgi:neurotransmitter:Na+ symporter, NSS family